MINEFLQGKPTILAYGTLYLIHMVIASCAKTENLQWNQMTRDHFLIHVRAERKVRCVQSQSSFPGMTCFPKHNEKFHKARLQKQNGCVHILQEITCLEIWAYHIMSFHPFKAKLPHLACIINYYSQYYRSAQCKRLCYCLQ